MMIRMTLRSKSLLQLQVELKQYIAAGWNWRHIYDTGSEYAVQIYKYS